MDAPESLTPSGSTPFPESVPEPNPPHPPRRHFPVGLLLPLLLIMGYWFYPQLIKLFPTKSPTVSPSASPTAHYSPVPNALNQLVYLRDPDQETAYNLDAYLIDPATQVETKLDLGPLNLAEAYKYYGSPWLFYRPAGDAGEYRLRNLQTGEEQSHTLITHPDPAALENVRIQNLNEISPDGKWFVFIADFFTVCPSPSPFPSGFQGGFGACQPDESLTTPYGYYLYNVESRSSTYLGDLIRVSRWDPAHHKLYYVENSVTKVLDLTTQTNSTIDSSSSFGYFTYPLFTKNLLVRHESDTDNTSQTASGHMSLVDLTTQRETTTFDPVSAWAVLQPFITADPLEQHALYLRSTLIDGLQRNAIYDYNLTTRQLSRLTPEDNTVSYSLYGEWLDDHTFVTLAHNVTNQGGLNSNNYLVKIDLNTRTLTRLTSHSQVAYFNSQ